MTVNHLQQLLQDLEDTRELVLAHQAAGEDGLEAAWRAARREAVDAFRDWCVLGGRDAYAVYVAAEDRADAAVEALAASR